MAELIISADDYGYNKRYDEGILEAARAGAVDAVSAFAAGADLDPEALLDTGVEIGLHLDLGTGADAPRAGDADRERARTELQRQHEAFSELFGRVPAFLDGHHHGHAREGLGVVTSDFAVERELPMRSISARHRRLLRCRGVLTPDLLVGRLSEDEPVLPEQLDVGAGEGLNSEAVIEWMVHPGRADPGSGSAYDSGREADLELLLGWEPPEGLRRRSHAAALLPGG